MYTCDLPDIDATAALGGRVAVTVNGQGLVVYLEGELGAGKTSFTRALLRALGVTGRIKSPTYTLIESYPLAHARAWHLDLYRIAAPGELEWLGLDALIEPNALVLVEWPEHGTGALPDADLMLRFAYAGSGRSVVVEPLSRRGEAVVAGLAGS